jgi:type II secretory ATPase GspE/PulE/Tfp pilus assembly ATPase PilB-like protein
MMARAEGRTSLAALGARLPSLIEGRPHATELVDALLAAAAELRAADILITPLSRESHAVRLRIDGIFHELCLLGREAAEKACARLKVLAGLRVYQTRRPQEGRISFAHDGVELDARLSFLPTIEGEHCAVRLFDPRLLVRPLGELGFSPTVTARLRELVHEPQGLLLLVGPTGSGKSTTIRALLQEVLRRDRASRQVISIEDPVEVRLPGVVQVEVNDAVGVSFDGALRAALRQSPEVLAIGEVRDGDTAVVAVRAALTGHLVLATIHAGDALAAIPRMLDLGADRHHLAGALLGILGQRLLPLPCGEGHTGRDCPRCLGAGIRGRTGRAELLLWERPLAELLTAPELDHAALRTRARAALIDPLPQPGEAAAAPGGQGRAEAGE